jgi:hypothetical protein
VAGALLFVVVEILEMRPEPAPTPDPNRYRIEIDAERVEGLTEDFANQMGRRPTPTELDRLIDAEIEEEMLFQEALALGLLERDGGVQTRMIQKMLFLEGGAEIDDAQALLDRALALELHRGDIVVRRILVQKMRLYASMLEADERPSEADVARCYAETRESLREPDRISFEQVFLSRDARGGAALRDARALAARLDRESVDLDRAIESGDPFPLGHHFESRSASDLERSFGAGFGAAAIALGPGRWSEPIESAYGWHLLRIEQREPGQIPELEAVADQIRRRLELEFQQAKLESRLGELRDRYEVVVRNPAKKVG